MRKIKKRAMETLPKVTVIIPSLNEAKGIGKCIKSILDGALKPFEIILADSHSKDGTDDIARKLGAKVIYTPRGGPGIARNVAAKIAKGDILAFTDADTVVANDWIERIAKNFANDKKLWGVGGIQKPFDGRIWDEFHYAIQLNILPRVGSFIGMGALSTANCAYRKDIFLAIGGFDESLSMFEDGELSHRMLKKGKLIVDGKLIVNTSARRMQQIGIIRLNGMYLRAFISLMGNKPIIEPYFDTIEH